MKWVACQRKFAGYVRSWVMWVQILIGSWHGLHGSKIFYIVQTFHLGQLFSRGSDFFTLVKYFYLCQLFTWVKSFTWIRFFKWVKLPRVFTSFSSFIIFLSFICNFFILFVKVLSYWDRFCHLHLPFFGAMEYGKA